MVCDEFKVLTHELLIHADEVTRQCLTDEQLLTDEGLANDAVHLRFRGPVFQFAEDETCKARVESLIPGDELVGVTETVHEPSLAEPENGTEGTREKDALDCREGDEARGERSVALHPLLRPLCLHAHAINRTHGVKEVLLLRAVLDVGVDQQAVRLRVDVLHHALEPVEAPRLGDGNLVYEVDANVLEYDAVTGREKGEHVLEEPFLVLRQ
eukprot:1177177-Rhodomonas_salina.2